MCVDNVSCTLLDFWVWSCYVILTILAALISVFDMSPLFLRWLGRINLFKGSNIPLPLDLFIQPKFIEAQMTFLRWYSCFLCQDLVVFAYISAVTCVLIVWGGCTLSSGFSVVLIVCIYLLVFVLGWGFYFWMLHLFLFQHIISFFWEISVWMVPPLLVKNISHCGGREHGPCCLLSLYVCNLLLTAVRSYSLSVLSMLLHGRKLFRFS